MRFGDYFLTTGKKEPYGADNLKDVMIISTKI